MTQQCDVAVVGGGLLGCALAYLLARDGIRVVLLERDQVNQHASGQNAGSLHFQLEYRMVERGLDHARRAAEAMPLHLDAAARWRDLAADVGPALGLAQHGGLMLAQDAQTARLLETKAEIERARGLDVTVLSREEVRDRAPYLAPSVVAAAYCPVEGRADARTAAPALARAAEQCGAQVRTRTAVTGMERAGTGWRLRTTGKAVAAEAVVLAGGAWTGELGLMVGARLPVTVLALTMTVTAPAPAFIPHLVQHAGTRLSLKQVATGNVLVGGGWPARLGTGTDGRPDTSERPRVLAESVAGNARAAIAAVPRLGRIPALRTWAGLTTVAPDQLPLVGAVPRAPGVFVATGGSAFTLGPTFAHVLSELVQGREPGVDLSPYDPGRYR